jgi:glycolate oxidase FAD binding subunit
VDLTVPTLGLDPARAVDPARFAIGGRSPRAALRPASAAEVAEAVRAAAAERLGVIPWGGATSLPPARAPERYDVAIDLSGLDRIVEYEPEDFTLTAEAGVTLASLRAALAARNQELPLEAPRAARATLGGAIAANASGARRLRFGAPRDRILGARFVLGDGTLARTGGKVVKNVAGYGLHRMLCGSRGGLAIVTEASFKVAPAPERRVALLYAESAASLARADRWAFAPRLEPSVLSVLGARAALALPEAARVGGAFTAIVGLEDEAHWVAEQGERVRAALGRPVLELEGEAAVALWQSLADAGALDVDGLAFAGPANTPASLEPWLSEPEAESFVLHAPCGRLHVAANAERAPRLAAALAEAGWSLIDAGRSIGEPSVAPQAAVLALRARIRAELDPGSTFVLGAAWAPRT